MVSQVTMIVFLFFGLAVCDLAVKNLAGPASEFSKYQIPDPLHSAISEDSALYELYLDHTGVFNQVGNKVYQGSLEFPVDSLEEFSFTLHTRLSLDDLDLSLYQPDGTQVENLKAFAIPGELQFGETWVDTTTWDFNKPQTGIWKLVIVATVEEERASTFIKKQFRNSEDKLLCQVAVDSLSDIKIVTHVNTYHLVRNQQIGLVAQLSNEATLENWDFAKMGRPSAMLLENVDAMLYVIYPDGSEKAVAMHDDGLHGDLLADDGVYGATVEATQYGAYEAIAKFTGDHDGTQFVRSSQHIVPVVDGSTNLIQPAIGIPPSPGTDQMEIRLQITKQINSVPQSYRAYAEVWGKTKDGQDQAACWIAGVVELKSENDQLYFPLILNVKWLETTGVQAPLTLKNVYISDLDYHVPLTHLDSLPVQTRQQEGLQRLYSVRFNASLEITEEMTKGIRPHWLSKRMLAPSSGGKLILVHGYCAPDNPWQKESGDFTDAEFFLEKDASMTNDEFAKKIVEFASSKGISRYSLAGFSQGGMAIVHLLNYYWSGADSFTSGRVIQSLCTPFQGNSGAGSAATLGKLFGIGCGSNFDLSRDGAPLWLNNIAVATRTKHHFYYTKYGSSPSYCNRAANLFLKKPNDGVAEETFATLPDANNAGVADSQCHNEKMAYPRATSFSSRNQEINSNAAR